MRTNESADGGPRKREKRGRRRENEGGCQRTQRRQDEVRAGRERKVWGCSGRRGLRQLAEARPGAHDSSKKFWKQSARHTSRNPNAKNSKTPKRKEREENLDGNLGREPNGSETHGDACVKRDLLRKAPEADIYDAAPPVRTIWVKLNNVRTRCGARIAGERELSILKGGGGAGVEASPCNWKGNLRLLPQKARSG